MSDTGRSSDELGKYLDPKILARIHRLDLRTRLVVEGFLAGLHRSPYRGLSVEFAQHREYVPGDDIRHVDWKVYSRTDRYYIKQYEEETNLRCTFLVDVSESMKYAGVLGGTGLNKFHYASVVAASLALLLLGQQDAAGLATFDEDLAASVPPSANPNNIKNIVHQLELAADTLKAKTAIEPICRKLAETLGRRGMVCLVSDLFLDEDELMRGLMRLTHAGHDVMVLQILDEEELTFPFEGNTRFRGLEQMGTVTGEPRRLREGYLDALGEFLTEVKRRCVSNRIGYAVINTADHLGAVLAEFLSLRRERAHKAASKRR
ncbi:MAG: DUF58 domain-containing protein [Thermoguttaceae bacterium]|jgi:uncharacterized protein (DUF58 family)